MCHNYNWQSFGLFLYWMAYHLISAIVLSFFLCVPQEHRQAHSNTREPLLENITSDYDLELFRKAQARASEDLVMGCFTSPYVSLALDFYLQKWFLHSSVYLNTQ